MFKTFKTYLISIILPVVVGLLSAFFTRNNMDIYSTLATPPLSPPATLFPVMWSILYVLMGISSAIMQLKKENLKEASQGLTFYRISLIFNFFWSIFFFNFRWLLFSFIWLLVLLYLIIRTILSYSRVSHTSAYLQIPYALWVAFAGYLNLGIWLLNM